MALLLVMVVAGLVVPSQSERVEAVPKYIPLGTQSQPVSLIIPSLEVRAPVEPILLRTDGVLVPPSDPDTVGWWDRSAMPGSAVGQTLMTGHMVRSGVSALSELGEMRPGQLVMVRTEAGTVHYRITKVVSLLRAEVAEQAYDLFGQDRGDGRLVLVTCTNWNGREHLSNLIAFADQLGVPNPAAPQNRPDTEPESAS